MKYVYMKKLKYIHIPKCAGKSIKNYLKKVNSNNKKYSIDLKIGHKPANYNGATIFISNKEKLNLNNKIICFVRNPFSRIVSMYHYHKINKKHKDFNEFVKKIYEDKELVKYLKNTKFLYPDKEYDLLKTPKGTDVAYSWKQCSTWITGDNFFYLGKIENIRDDLKKICKKLRVGFNEDIIHINKTSHKDYRSYYNENSIKIIEEIYHDDLINFNYKF